MNKPIPKGEQVTGDMLKGLDNRFLNALLLKTALDKKGSDRLEVTIDRVEYHDVLQYENGQKEHDAKLLYFVGSDRPLKLNATNITRIANQHGGYSAEGWHGKKINLCIEQTRRPDLGGKQGPCVRVARNIQKPTFG